MVDPDLRIRRGGGEGPVIQILRWGRVRSPKKFFSALRATVWSKNRGGGPPGPLPYIRHCFWLVYSSKLIMLSLILARHQNYRQI